MSRFATKLKPGTAVGAVLFLVWGSISFFVDNQYYTHMMFLMSIYAILASSLNLAVGITGLSNMSHAAFFSVGAYAAAVTALRWNFPFYVTLILGGLLALAFGLLLGFPTLRLKGFYLALVTIGFGQIVRIIELNWTSVTRGPMGLPGIPSASLGGNRFSVRAYIIYSLLVLLLTLFTSSRLLDSKVGRAWSAIKSDEVVATSLGVKVSRYKVMAFAISAFFAGMAGTIYAHYITFISPDSFTSSDSTIILCMVIIGGTSSLLGPVLGAIVLVAAPELLRFAEFYRTIFIGVILVVAIIAKENNWWGIVKDKAGRLLPRKKHGEV